MVFKGGLGHALVEAGTGRAATVSRGQGGKVAIRVNKVVGGEDGLVMVDGVVELELLGEAKLRLGRFCKGLAAKRLAQEGTS